MINKIFILPAQKHVQKSIQLSKGITLLEVVIYVALFSICFSTIMLTVFSMQKTMIRISEKRNKSMANMYLHEYLRHRYHGGIFISADELSIFGQKIASLMEMPVPETVSLEVLPHQESPTQKNQLKFIYKINNQNQEIKIDMI